MKNGLIQELLVKTLYQNISIWGLGRSDFKTFFFHLTSSQDQQVRFDRLESHDGRRLQVTVADFNTQAAFAGRSSSGSVSGFVAL